MHKFFNPVFPLSRSKYVLLLAIFLSIKSIFAYIIDFRLDFDHWYQYLILLFNPLGSVLCLVSVTLLIKNSKRFLFSSSLLYLMLNLFLVANVLYYREYTDYLTINTMLGVGNVAGGLFESVLNIFRWYDLFYLADFFAIAVLLVRKQVDFSQPTLYKRQGMAFISLGLLVLSMNLFVSEIFRNGLLTRTFSRDYLVKYVGLNAFLVHDGLSTYNTNRVRAASSPSDLTIALDYVKDHYAEPDVDKFGIAEGKNVIILHLESLQQFVIDYELEDSEGNFHEVTPFLNRIFHSSNTYSFDNFFHQVSAGRTSDAETMMENSLFGLNQGSLFTKLGGDNVFEAAPDILGQVGGYTSAVFHGNIGSFWNRTDTYKQFGYNYFFDETYYELNEENSFQYGLMDKQLFSQSIQYFEHLQQPFYAKFLTVSNHWPYNHLSEEELGFPLANTGDSSVDHYFSTANYMDTALEEFVDYLKNTGVYENSIILLYGDHYGIPSSSSKTLANFLGEDTSNWTEANDIQLQRVPFMIHIPDVTDGQTFHTYGGEIDALPTLLHILGIDTKNYLQLGQDLFSESRNEIVAFRNGNFITPEYIYIDGKIYGSQSGEEMTEIADKLQAEVDELKLAVDTQLQVSDSINNGGLLRFYKNSGLKGIEVSDFDYTDQLERLIQTEDKLGENSTSIFSKNGNQSTANLFSTKTFQEIKAE